MLRFYDGLCSWEEDSTTPVLHIGWVKPIVKTFLSFEHAVRSQLSISTMEQTEGNQVLSFGGDDYHHQPLHFVPDTINNNYKRTIGDEQCDSYDCDDEQSIYDKCSENYFDENLSRSENFESMSSAKLLKFAKSLDGCQPSSIPKSQNLNYLVQKSGEKIFNFEFFLGKEESMPFVDIEPPFENALETNLINTPIPEEPKREKQKSKNNNPLKITLESVKIGALKEILQSEKMNSSALHLQLTAQTQTDSGKKQRTSLESDGRAKRLRRE